ncbi:MAG: hypothetical protein LBF67_00335 [Prevotellaceae bacterium]|nr:hypothetical protein [Prevotellaceae bacterium]
MEEISRKKFLRLCGAIVAGGAVAGVSGVVMSRGVSYLGATSPDKLKLGNDDTFTSPYRLVSSFDAPGTVQALAQHGGTAYAVTANEVLVLDARGRLQRQFPVKDDIVRDAAVDDGEIYLLHPAKICVYSPAGDLLREWEACSELSNYCSLALSTDFVFVTDINNKNICQYTREGRFVRFIGSPNKFIIPSLTFGIECIGDVIYCSNSGRHQVESYALDGKYLAVFGRHGAAPGLFTGCCNPVYLSHTASGDIITSEKGDPRICCYGRDGSFRSMLLDSRLLGGGNTAYDVKVWKDRLFVAGKNKISVFRYDETLASAGACASCSVDCPLRTGVDV